MSTKTLPPAAPPATPPVTFIGGATWTPKPTGLHPLQAPSRGAESQRMPRGGSSGAAGDGRTSESEGR